MKHNRKIMFAVIALILLVLFAVLGIMIHKKSEAKRADEAKESVEIEIPDDSSGETAAEPEPAGDVQKTDTTDTDEESDSKTDTDEESDSKTDSETDDDKDPDSSGESEENQLPEITIQ